MNPLNIRLTLSVIYFCPKESYRSLGKVITLCGVDQFSGPVTFGFFPYKIGSPVHLNNEIA